MDSKHRCSAAGCECKNFVGTADQLRICDGCSHSWLTHLLERLVRNKETLTVLDVCSLALYGAQAVPIRLKILIERLLSTLPSHEIDKILRSFGWTPLDLARGYMIQDRDGQPLSRWSILPREEEPLILEQFHRFRATQSLTMALMKKDLAWGEEGDEEGSPEEMDNLVLNLSSVGPPSSMTSESAPGSSDEEEEAMTAVDLSSKSDRSRDSRSTTRNGQVTDREGSGRDRKSSESPPTARKHSWNLPSAPVVSTLPNGKRRVECSVCLKTFCDKGALKIHFSAVHLREMHKCTVSGCSMMFSSRRSRNRHSANPNPKLHSPHMRRKISPHDGRTSHPLLTFPPGTCFPPFGLTDEHDTDDQKRDDTPSGSPRVSLSPPSVVSDEILVRGGSGARKRKLGNPMRVSNSPDSKEDPDDFPERRQPSGHKFQLPLSPSRSESNPSSPTDGINPLQCLATKVFNFNNHFQNLHLNGLPERWSENLFAPRPRLEFLFDTKSLPVVPPVFEEEGQRASVW